MSKLSVSFWSVCLCFNDADHAFRPLKVQVGIRDYWDKDDAPVQKALSSLKEVIGINIVVLPEWQLLLAELESFYPDKGTLVPVVAGCVQAWCNAMSALLDDEANEEWADTLLERTYGTLRLFIEVSKNNIPKTTWSDERVGFIISLPKAEVPSPMEMEPTFKGSLISCFDKKRTASGAVSHGMASVDDWADVSMDTETGTPGVIEAPQQQSPSGLHPRQPELNTLPSCSTLARPDELLLKPPYHLVVYSRGGTLVEVQSSHSPSLRLLAEYLKKWCRVNHQDNRKPPCVEVKLHQSAFGLGLMYDRLTLSVEGRYSTFTVTPMIVLSLIEGVLGYKTVFADNSSWAFRKDIKFTGCGY
ncbi:uncharacterized protein BCR38DRAFT_349091 [Pseudomassariella vexata]|uniref:Uncharacterized protein n=1 Tax=Pseudomassariella vexata TaxID=1141098 RepID=A0A1Y2DNX8_9PEZI|nr:uncharacterized protein BCR38DRAFT_349091 [Pseudomassariella vexata]ORY60917.1 hypothetical protein BCR38DRAFT_349091 [Pseudomassariella vexata]